VRRFYGTNPPPGTSIDYLLTVPAKSVALKIVDVNGTTVRSFTNPSGEVGFHRFRWDLSGSGGGGGFGGFGGRGGGSAVPAGAYRVVLTVDGKDYAQTVIVENDPKADPQAIITYESSERAEMQTDATDDREVKTIIPFIPPAQDD
jgi:flagellar hook assembly protein FlgD